jgi:hypothetical protein
MVEILTKYNKYEFIRYINHVISNESNISLAKIYYGIDCK